MKLLIDIGNTRIKSAWLHKGQLVEHRSLAWRGEALAARLPELWHGSRPSAVAISAVASGDVLQQVCALVRDYWGLEAQIACYQGEQYGLRCGYEQPESLGVDRWLALLGAWGRRPSAWLVADLGTAVTLDVVDNSGQHLGGCIYAGIETQRHALSLQTAALPEVNNDRDDLLARDTRGGIAVGTLLSVAGGVRELYSSARGWPGCEGIALCLTGGASPAIAARLDDQVPLFPSLVLEGLAMSVFAEKISVQEPIAKQL